MKRWKKEEEELLKEIFKSTDNLELEKIFDRSYLSIYKKSIKLNLKRDEKTEFKNRSKPLEKSHAWKGGKIKRKSGYVFIMDKNHPNCDSNGYVQEHRIIFEKYLKRYLKKNEIIHHINGIKDDNRKENLELKSVGEHTKLHHIGLKRSCETKKKISEKAKKRFCNKKNHPLYKDVKKEILKLKENGKTINEICKTLKICNRTYYNKLKEE